MKGERGLIASWAEPGDEGMNSKLKSEIDLQSFISIMHFSNQVKQALMEFLEDKAYEDQKVLQVIMEMMVFLV